MLTNDPLAGAHHAAQTAGTTGSGGPCLLLEQTIEAHGGWERWRRVNCIQAALSSGGLAFASRCQPFALHHLSAAVYPHEPRVELRNFGRPGGCGVWTPQRVFMRDEHGQLIGERSNPRPLLNRVDKWVVWDKLDILYFAGYALWNYLSFPFILKAPGVSVVAAGAQGDATDRLFATFDASVATHSAAQVFHLDASRTLLRHDYTADVIGRWATAANCCFASEQVSGLRFYTRRKVYPRFGQRLVLPFPTLVWIELDDIQVQFDVVEAPAPRDAGPMSASQGGAR